jgi:hypothetical protein
MRLGVAIPMVGVAAWHACGAAGLHGGGWQWPVVCIADVVCLGAWVLAGSEIGCGGPGGVSPPWKMLCYVLVLRRRCVASFGTE